MEARKSRNTKLLFCTTGVILRRLQDDPELTGVTHAVVDEVSIFVDCVEETSGYYEEGFAGCVGRLVIYGVCCVLCVVCFCV